MDGFYTILILKKKRLHFMNAKQKMGNGEDKDCQQNGRIIPTKKVLKANLRIKNVSVSKFCKTFLNL